MSPLIRGRAGLKVTQSKYTFKQLIFSIIDPALNSTFMWFDGEPMEKTFIRFNMYFDRGNLRIMPTALNIHNQKTHLNNHCFPIIGSALIHFFPGGGLPLFF